ncbi:hypothetical protein [Kitasatospora aureofaciens]|uniref:hypothetical protein n=1 Tax=Kitasatospora aureofaciens TaxID=1894 RepID=UPI0033F7CB9D
MIGPQVGEDDVATRWTGVWGPSASPLPQSRLEWREPPSSHRQGLPHGPFTVGDFTRVLREAQILDNRAVEATGAAVVLPYGVALLERFRQLVRAAYEDAGLAEHEYPHTVPLSVAEPTREVVDLHDRLLLVGTDTDLAQGKPRLALTPTGEMVIYSHWARAISGRGDLPIRMYQRARYFRPVRGGRHGGRGVFHATEHDDVFEFHCAHADRDSQQQDLRRLRDMVANLIGRFHVPVVWSTRPPWTNRAEVADLAVAADAPLPLQATGQIACLYDQGTRFSRPYRIGFREQGDFHLSQQLAGYTSRRILMAHLMLGLHGRRQLFIHPDLAPVQVLVLLRGQASSPQATSALGRALAEGGVLVREVGCESAGALTKARREWQSRGVPVTVQLFEPRSAGEQWKAVLVRGDTGEECTVYCADPAVLAPELRALLADLGAAFANGAWEFARSRLVLATASDLPEVLAQRLVAVSALSVSEDAVRNVAALRRGEVLGFCRTDRSLPCVVTGKPVTTVAFVSPRM